MATPPAIDNGDATVDAGDHLISKSPGEGCSDADVSKLRHRAGEFASKADELEQRMSTVVEFYATKKPAGNNPKGPAGRHGAARKYGVYSSRIPELMRQLGTIIRQLSQHKNAWPFMDPVDVEGLGLYDYYAIIKKPMDFSTIRSQMEAKSGSGYRHVREIYADVKLIFTNAMTYNDESHEIHGMAKMLLDKFEEKWLQLLPKVIEEEARQKEEEACAVTKLEMAQEAIIAKLARDINNELNELNVHLEKLREMVVQNCRKISVYEKRQLGAEISSLSPEDLDKALQIIAQDNPSFQITTNDAVIDMDAQSQTTLWKLRIFVKRALELQSKNVASRAGENLKRKKEICDVPSRTAKKRNKKASLTNL